MQFEITAVVIGLRRQVIDGKSYVSVFVAEEPSAEELADGCSGLRVTKIPADDAVIPQLPRDYKPLTAIKFLAVLKSAAGGKAQPHIVGVVPASAGAKA
ncbi:MULTISPECIES: hypothetical protein [Pseudomonas]|uniref:hypothetical protein n=1 Tax=Pseudomonas TaxID=286 RepID=UPI001F323667|nr:hypothetical protein [Pseudomonas tohonis]